MNMHDDHDHELRAVFEHQRHCDHATAPVWRDEWLNSPQTRPAASRRWIPAVLAAACVVAMMIILPDAPKSEPSLSEVLPPLFDAPPAELFATIEPSFTAFEAPSDFLLPAHLHLDLP